MSYVTEHACPSTLLLIHLRNARDLSQAACLRDPAGALHDLSPTVATSVHAAVQAAFDSLSQAIAAVEAERGPEPVART